jgi:hypothetical protein
LDLRIPRSQLGGLAEFRLGCLEVAAGQGGLALFVQSFRVLREGLRDMEKRESD